ncbi:MAG: response regulator transcription factor [Lachnospiraceae bacterium]|nr:response regulator transcription factor [Lachnospiraceae bacterium]
MAVIYIVEDDGNICEIETFSLKNSGYTVESFSCAKDFYRQLETALPNLILLDVMLPDEDGLSIVKRLRSRFDTKKIPIILVTAKTSELDKVKGLDIGADDYITKPFGVMELISRVKAMLRRSMDGTEREEAGQMQVGEIVMDQGRHVVLVKGEICELTYKEYELLKFLISNAGMVLSRERIMDRVWGIDFEGESRTLDMHIKTLRQKLREAGGCIKTVRNVGYIIEEG